MLLRVVWQKFNDVSEVLVAFVIRAIDHGATWQQATGADVHFKQAVQKSRSG
jgi:hypothetical protein